MNITHVRQLHAGDQVKWNDPDDGICTKVIDIVAIFYPITTSDVIKIWGKDGSYLECYAKELS